MSDPCTHASTRCEANWRWYCSDCGVEATEAFPPAGPLGLDCDAHDALAILGRPSGETLRGIAGWAE